MSRAVTHGTRPVCIDLWGNYHVSPYDAYMESASYLMQHEHHYEPADLVYDAKSLHVQQRLARWLAWKDNL